MKIHKKAIRALVLMSVVLGGVFCPFAGAIIPAMQQVAQAAEGDAVWDYSSDGTILKVSTGNLPTSFKYDTGLSGVETIEFAGDDYGGKTVLPADSSGMFAVCSNLKRIDGEYNIDTSNVTNMAGMFAGCSSLTTLNLDDEWDVSHVTNMYEMFDNCTSLTQLYVSGWNTSQVTNMENMFYNCHSLNALDLRAWNVSNVENMGYMFAWCENLTGLGVDNWDTSKVTNMSNMFNDVERLTYLNVSNFNTAEVTDMSEMFAGMRNVTSLDVSHFNTAKVTEMVAMFEGTENLTSLDVSHFNTANVHDMAYMFKNMTKLTTLDLTNFVSKTDQDLTDAMFYGMTSMWKLILGPNFRLDDNPNLPDPSIGTNYNNSFEVNSTLWLHKTGGTDANPTGNEFAAEYLATNHQAGATDTYIWQGTNTGTTVGYSLQPSYTITIPTSIAIPTANTAGTGFVTLSANPKLPFDNRFIHIFATSAAWKLSQPGDTNGAAYTLKANDGAAVLSAGDQISFEANGETTPDPVELAAQLTDASHQFKYAGSYSDIVTFNIQTAGS
ncbi:MAG: BspA family leucine-rich repeat surface protein [Lactobacillaceae bacterium]|jgi:surface protein|nr:BspA family leucine-rich repeat surface protein [Lactobacillaceae bacterium]